MTQSQMILLSIVVTVVFAIGGYFSTKFSYDFVDETDLRWGILWMWLSSEAAIVCFIVGVVAPGLACMIIFTGLVGWFFISGTLSPVDYLVVKRNGKGSIPAKGPGRYLVARHVTVSTASTEGHGIKFVGNDAIEAISLDLMKITVEVSAYVVPKLDGMPKGSAEEAARKAQVALLKANMARQVLWLNNADGTPAVDPVEPEVAAKLLADRIAAETAVAKAQFEADTAAYAALLVAADPDQEAKEDETYRRAVAIIGDSDKVNGKAKPLLEQAVRNAVGTFFALDASAAGREALRAAIQASAGPLLLAGPKYELKSLVLGAVVPEEGLRVHGHEMQSWLDIEATMGVMGLAKHRADALAKAGIVVMPSASSL